MAGETERTLKECRAQGWLAWKVEYWQPSFAARNIIDAVKANKPLGPALNMYHRMGPGKRIDPFGFIDVLVIRGQDILAIQSTSADGVSARLKKMRTEPDVREAVERWVATGNAVEIWGWRKYKKAVDRKFWRPVIKVISPELLAMEIAKEESPF